MLLNINFVLIWPVHKILILFNCFELNFKSPFKTGGGPNGTHILRSGSPAEPFIYISS